MPEKHEAPQEPLSGKAFIDWDGWLWDRDGDGKLFVVTKDSETWLAGYRAALAKGDGNA